MNVYMVVEGRRTEPKVYPAWLSLLKPDFKRVDSPKLMTGNSYYLFSACGIPAIYKHIVNSVKDIEEINSCVKQDSERIDLLMVCMDVEEESREYVLSRIGEELAKENVECDVPIAVFEQKICMDTWFLGNRKDFKSNPQDEKLCEYIRHYNVSEDDPELMACPPGSRFETKAQFHYDYLRRMLRERGVVYSKSSPNHVTESHYLDRLIARNLTTGHIPSFGRWYDFVMKNF